MLEKLKYLQEFKPRFQSLIVLYVHVYICIFVLFFSIFCIYLWQEYVPIAILFYIIHCVYFRWLLSITAAKDDKIYNVIQIMFHWDTVSVLLKSSLDT